MFYFIFAASEICCHGFRPTWPIPQSGPEDTSSLVCQHSSAFDLTSTYLWLACKLIFVITAFCLLLSQFWLSYRPFVTLMLFCSWGNICARGEESSWLWRLGSHLKVPEKRTHCLIERGLTIRLCSSFLINNLIKYRPVKKCILKSWYE